MVIMDLMSTIAVATPFLAKGIEAFSSTTGEKLGSMVGELCAIVGNKFKGDNNAEQILASAKKEPDSKEHQVMLKEVLSEKMQEDPDFANKVRNIVDKIQDEQGMVHTNFDLRGQKVKGNQTFIDNVYGPVNIGDSQGGRK
jgi:hypothetical protein